MAVSDEGYILSMKKFKRILKTIALVLLILLACFGVGFTGVGPIAGQHRKNLLEVAKTEQIDEDLHEDDIENEEII